MTHFQTPRLAWSVCLLTGLLLLAGCGSDKPSPVRVSGQLALPTPDQTLPAGAVARVSFIEEENTGSRKRIVAERTIHNLKQLPIKFALSLDPAMLDRGAKYGMTAQISNAHNGIIYQSGAPRPVAVFDNPRGVQLAMHATAAAGDTRFATYVCHDAFRFDVARTTNGAVIHLGNRQISLHAASSVHPGSTRYIDAHQDELVIGEGVTSIYFDGISHHDCERAGASADKTARAG